MHNKKIFDLENESQGHGIQHSQWSHSMANVNLYKSHTWTCSLALTVFEIFTFKSVWPWKCGSRSWCTTTVVPFNGKYLTSYLMVIVMFAFSSVYLSKIANWIVGRGKFRSTSLNTTFVMVQFDGKYQFLYKSYLDRSHLKVYWPAPTTNQSQEHT